MIPPPRYILIGLVLAFVALSAVASEREGARADETTSGSSEMDSSFEASCLNMPGASKAVCEFVHEEAESIGVDAMDVSAAALIRGPSTSVFESSFIPRPDVLFCLLAACLLKINKRTHPSTSSPSNRKCRLVTASTNFTCSTRTARGVTRTAS